MAGRILNRRELRRQSDAAESAELDAAPDEADDAEEDEEVAEGSDEGSDEAGDDEAPPTKAKKAKPKAAAKPRKPRKPKAAPRMRARWGVFDASMKQLAIFDYKDRAGADAKVAELAAKKNGTFFLQIVKEPMPEDAEPAPASA